MECSPVGAHCIKAIVITYKTEDVHIIIILRKDSSATINGEDYDNLETVRIDILKNFNITIFSKVSVATENYFEE